ncbi:energy transducer TonB [Mangrovitalea sediminis]|uniref:energy transducer TonB n=1 Tax=Mangrovitalea sediminis TaxID=1982043 RepID=UPI000BE5B340|nr:energy transducer TonB [Mangrovitalea sediminis]
MASPHRLTSFLLALGGAVAAHALLLTLPLRELPVPSDSRETLQIHLAARAGSNATLPSAHPSQPVQRAHPAPTRTKTIAREITVKTPITAEPEHPSPQHQARPYGESKPLISTRSPLAETVTGNDRAPNQPQPKPVQQPQTSGSSAPTAVTGVATAGSLRAPRVNADTTLNPAAQRQMNNAFQARLSAYLAHFRHYPLLARREGQTGTVKLHFVMDRQGRVLSRSLTQRTPYPLLNREALMLLDRAAPLPRPPASLAGNALSYTLPITFEIR